MILKALPAFMSSEEKGVGYLDSSEEEKRAAAQESRSFVCKSCGFVAKDFSHKEEPVAKEESVGP